MKSSLPPDKLLFKSGSYVVTAGFTLPLLHRLSSNPSNGKRNIRALILTPTRELAW